LVRRVDQFAPPNGTTISETAYALSAESCGICGVADLGHVIVLSSEAGGGMPVHGTRTEHCCFPVFPFLDFLPIR
jgi:hypothetical protein